MVYRAARAEPSDLGPVDRVVSRGLATRTPRRASVAACQLHSGSRLIGHAALPQNGAGEVADWIGAVCLPGIRNRLGEAWRVLPPAPGLALHAADRVSVSCARTAGRGPTGGRGTRGARDGRDLIGA